MCCIKTTRVWSCWLRMGRGAWGSKCKQLRFGISFWPTNMRRAILLWSTVQPMKCLGTTWQRPTKGGSFINFDLPLWEWTSRVRVGILFVWCFYVGFYNFFPQVISEISVSFDANDRSVLDGIFKCGIWIFEIWFLWFMTEIWLNLWMRKSELTPISLLIFNWLRGFVIVFDWLHSICLELLSHCEGL